MEEEAGEGGDDGMLGDGGGGGMDAVQIGNWEVQMLGKVLLCSAANHRPKDVHLVCAHVYMYIYKYIYI